MRVEKLMSNELAVQIEEIQKRLDALEARRTPGPRGPAGDITAAVDNAEKAAKAIVIERLDSYVQRTETIARRVQQQVDSANQNIRNEFQGIVKSAAVKALRDALENEVALLVLKILVEYQVADIAGDPIKID
jgi:DNA-binding transcriptional MerR regulator